MQTTLAFMNLGGWEIALLALAALLLFGGKRLPEVGKSLGRGIVEFKKGLQGLQEDIDNAGKSDDKTSNQIEEKKDTAVSERDAESATKSS